MDMHKFVASLSGFEKEELRHALNPTEGEEAEIALYRSGEIIFAIKARRSRTCESLKECRDFFLKLQD